MTETAYCRECGTTISELASDCPECGAPQRDGGGDGRLSLFTAILLAIVGLGIYPIIAGPIAAVAGFDAYTKRGGYIAAAACAVGVINTLYGTVTTAMAMGYV